MTHAIQIGVSGPFTGPRSAYGDMLRETAQACLVNANLIFADDMADVDQALRVADRFIAQQVKAVVGHFNSDCARAVGPAYHAAGIPFLMPAATAPDLIDCTQGYRICAPDDAQIDALARWLESNDTKLAEVWQDNSPYAARLSQLLQERGLIDSTQTETDAPIAILGAHHAVADEILRRAPIARPIFVPDDCAIAEFDALLAGTPLRLLRVNAAPDYPACVAIAFERLAAAQADGQSLKDALARDPEFEKGQYRMARFDLIEDNTHTTRPYGRQS